LDPVAAPPVRLPEDESRWATGAWDAWAAALPDARADAWSTARQGADAEKLAGQAPDGPEPGVEPCWQKPWAELDAAEPNKPGAAQSEAQSFAVAEFVGVEVLPGPWELPAALPQSEELVAWAQQPAARPAPLARVPLAAL